MAGVVNFPAGLSVAPAGPAPIHTILMCAITQFMRTGPRMAEIAALVGDPARANMLSALLDGRALTASGLAYAAHVTPQTASTHLSKLTEGVCRPDRRARRLTRPRRGEPHPRSGGTRGASGRFQKTSAASRLSLLARISSPERTWISRLKPAGATGWGPSSRPVRHSLLPASCAPWAASAVRGSFTRRLPAASGRPQASAVASRLAKL
jgi:Helix-turn-helix domain